MRHAARRRVPLLGQHGHAQGVPDSRPRGEQGVAGVGGVEAAGKGGGGAGSGGRRFHRRFRAARLQKRDRRRRRVHIDLIDRRFLDHAPRRRRARERRDDGRARGTVPREARLPPRFGRARRPGRVGGAGAGQSPAVAVAAGAESLEKGERGVGGEKRKRKTRSSPLLPHLDVHQHERRARGQGVGDGLEAGDAGGTRRVRNGDEAAPLAHRQRGVKRNAPRHGLHLAIKAVEVDVEHGARVVERHRGAQRTADRGRAGGAARSRRAARGGRPLPRRRGGAPRLGGAAGGGQCGSALTVAASLSPAAPYPATPSRSMSPPGALTRTTAPLPRPSRTR